MGKKGEALGWEIEAEREGAFDLQVARHSPIPEVRQLVPAAARAGDHFVISSSRQLCLALIGAFGADGPKLDAEKDLAFELQFAELGKFFAANEAAYKAQFERSGRSPEQAQSDYANLTKLLTAMEALRGESSSNGGIFEFEVRAASARDPSP